MKKLNNSLLFAMCFSPLVIANETINYGDYRAINTPVNYSFINLEGGKQSFDAHNNNLMIARISGQKLLNESFIFKMGYQAEFLDDANNDNKHSHQDNLANIGIGWRYPIFKATDVELDGHLLYNWNNDNDVEKNEVGYRVGAAINHGFGDSFDVKVNINYSAIDGDKTSSAGVNITQYITRYVGVGINGSIADSDSPLGDMNYIGIHVNLAFY